MQHIHNVNESYRHYERRVNRHFKLAMKLGAIGMFGLLFSMYGLMRISFGLGIVGVIFSALIGVFGILAWTNRD